ncbi:hypothetical protein OH77DRAFT_1426513 [Trametes cingulata]|nr:hypothetical protein OH77DRAFT_1426513 [Trametes cingulata]
MVTRPRSPDIKLTGQMTSKPKSTLACTPRGAVLRKSAQTGPTAGCTSSSRRATLRLIHGTIDLRRTRRQSRLHAQKCARSSLRTLKMSSLYQHRTGLLSLFIIGEEFRVMWWDRSGVIVSKRLNYVNDPKPLLQFIWHFVQLSDERQGLDPTASLLKEDDAEFELMDKLAKPHSLDMDYLEPGTEHIVTESPLTASAGVRPSSDEADPPEAAGTNRAGVAPSAKEDERRPVFKYVRQQFRASLATAWPRYKLEVGEEKRVFLVAKPIFKASTMFGRATRGYVAVDVKTGCFVFLKDSWRPYYAGVDCEGSYLELFAKDRTDMDVPTVICHGDVGRQRAFTAIYEGTPQGRKAKERSRLEALGKTAVQPNTAPSGSRSRKRARPDYEAEAESIEEKKATNNESLRHHIHYRIAVEEVCLPFTEFRTTEQLIRLMSHCIETHYWAYTRYRLLHRDISAGNVLILPTLVKEENGEEIVEWRGVLTDWELAKAVPQKGEEDVARQPERTGTWQFMSVDYIDCNWTRPIVVADELESFFHVLMFYAVRFLPNTLPSVTAFVIEYFDTFSPAKPGGRSCGLAKRSLIRNGTLEYGMEYFLFLKTTREQGNPLNVLLFELLKLFAARYQVIHQARQAAALQRGRDAPKPPVASAAKGSPPRTHQRKNKPSWFKDRQPVVSSGKTPDLIVRRDTGADSERTLQKLDTHEEFLNLFEETLRLPREDWRDTEVVGHDQLVNYELRIVFAAQVDSTTAARNSAKRPKTDDDTPSAPAFGPSKSAATDSFLSISRSKGRERARRV